MAIIYKPWALYCSIRSCKYNIFEIGNSSGIQGINGPPGTGKTTLLLDVIAEIIMKRAQVLSEIGYSRIFEKGYDKIEKENGFTLYSYNINNKLLNDFGIIVASNNNSAVENITKELPAKKKIDAKTFLKQIISLNVRKSY
jgi:ABC-type transporter Mla maintaining outer membrane lipid asymmetry ATPase subunit MlaF